MQSDRERRICRVSDVDIRSVSTRQWQSESTSVREMEREREGERGREREREREGERERVNSLRAYFQSLRADLDIGKISSRGRVSAIFGEAHEGGPTTSPIAPFGTANLGSDRLAPKLKSGMGGSKRNFSTN